MAQKSNIFNITAPRLQNIADAPAYIRPDSSTENIATTVNELIEFATNISRSMESPGAVFDELTVTANANFANGTLFVDAVNNRVGIGNTTPNDTLRVQGTASVSGAVNALSTLGVSGAVNALSTLGVTGTLTALGVMSVSGNLSVLQNLSVSGDLVVAGNQVVTGNVTTEGQNIVLLSETTGTPSLNAAIIVNRGTSPNTSLLWDEVNDSWVITANANFDSGTLFVDAVNNRVGIGNTSPSEALRVQGTASVSGAVNALSTLGVSGAVNALSTVGVSGAVNALSTFGVSGAMNALSTMGVTGTFAALGQMTVAANANFDSGTLFVDAVNNRVGIGNTSPSEALRVQGTASVSGAVNALSTMGVSGAVNALSTLGVSGAVNVLSTLGVTGTLAALGQMTVAANANFDSGTLFVDAVNNRVGIGNTSPGEALRVQGTASVSGAVNALSTMGVSGAMNALSTLGVSGAVNALSTVGVSGAVNALSTVGVSGAVNALSTMGVSGAMNALSTVGVSGAVNALSTMGVSGAVNALSTFGVSGAMNALSTLGVTGTLAALGEMTVAANANFDGGTLFVDAVNNRVGIGNTTPNEALRVQGTASVSGAVNALSTMGVGDILTVTAAARSANGTAAAPAWSYIADTASGWYLPAAATLGVSTGGTERVRVTNTAMRPTTTSTITLGTSTAGWGTLYLDTNGDVSDIDMGLGNVTFRQSSDTLTIQNDNQTSLIITPLLTTINTALHSGATIPFASRTTGWGISRDGSADFRYLYADEMHVKNFIADLEQALAGGQIITKSVAVLHTDFTAPANGAPTLLYVEDLPGASGMPVFQDEDYVVLRSFSRANGSLIVADCVGVVNSSITGLVDTAGINYQSWLFTRAATGSAGSLSSGTVIEAGSLVLDYGTSGGGYYEVTAVDGQYAEFAPYAQIVTWTDAPISTNRQTRGRLGNLKGITSESQEYGLLAGDYTNRQYFRASNKAFDLYGIDLRLFASSPTTPAILLSRGASNTNPYISVGNAAPSSFTSGIGIWMGRDATVADNIESAYRFRVGNPNGTRLSWNGSAVLIGDSQNNHLVANAGILSFQNEAETLATLSGTQWTLGQESTNHLVINTTALIFRDGPNANLATLEGTRWTLGQESTNHLVINSTALIFRDGPNANLATLEGTQWTLGQESTNHLVINSTALIFRDGPTANLATLTTSALVLGKPTQPRVEITSTALKLYRDTTNVGVTLNSDGSGSLASGNISWNTTGNFTITGNITATSGSIGGWSVNTVAIVRDTGTAATSAGLAPNDIPFYAGATYANRASAPFRVNTAGAITATNLNHSGGTISGWTINTVAIVRDTGTAATSAGLAPDDIPFYAGATYNNRASAPFRVNTAGAVTTTNLIQTGGFVGGWTINSSSIAAGNLLLQNTGNITMGTGADIARLSASDDQYRLWIGNTAPTDANFWVSRQGIVQMLEVQGNVKPASAGLFYIGDIGTEWYQVVSDFFGIDDAVGLRYLKNPTATSGNLSDVATWVFDAVTGHYVGGKYTSSLRYKTNLEHLSSQEAFETILKLTPKKYHRIGFETSRKEAGFIAEEVEAALPHLTTRSGEPEPGVAILEIISYLVGAVHHLHARLNACESHLGLKG